MTNLFSTDTSSLNPPKRRSSRASVERCLSAIADPQGEGALTYLTVWENSARAVADAIDALGVAAYPLSPIAGMPVSVKDFLDVAGEVTRAGALPLDDRPPAHQDAPVVARVKAAGAVLLGRTNMTPFAYSVVGLNAHFGTPGNPADPTRTPGGSSSGAAVSVAANMAVAAIGSDTVGSIRVPAALCGIVGFKPTQSRVPLEGAIPLSVTLDSIGPLGRSVDHCAELFGVLAGETRPSRMRTGVKGLRLALPGRRFFEGLDVSVARAFQGACRRLNAAGIRFGDGPTQSLDALADGDLLSIIQSVEAFAAHEDLLARRGDDYDTRIRARIERGRTIQAADYARAQQRRTSLKAAFAREMADIDALVLPTVPVVAPTFAQCEADEDGMRTILMRNTAPFNVLDATAITLPIQEPGELPVGLMLVAPSGQDFPLLDIGHAVEAVLSFRGERETHLYRQPPRR